MQHPSAAAAPSAAGFPCAFLLRCPVLLALERLMPSCPTVYRDGAPLSWCPTTEGETSHSNHASVFSSLGGDHAYMEVMDASPDDKEQ